MNRYFLILFLSVAAVAATDRPLLLRETLPGSIQPPWNKIRTKCGVSSEKLTHERSIAGIHTLEAKPLSIKDIGSVDELIQKASLGSTTQVQGPTDAPTVNYYAYKPNGEVLVLKVKDEMGVVSKNSSREAESLMHFLNAHCAPIPNISLP